MDKVLSAVLQKLCATTGIGRYAIISEEEFIEALPESDAPDADLRRALSSLSEDGYIDIKYSGGDMYCIAPIKLPPPPPSEVEAPTPEETVLPPAMPERRPFPAFLSSAAGGFFGALIGGIIATLILAVL